MKSRQLSRAIDYRFLSLLQSMTTDIAIVKMTLPLLMRSLYFANAAPLFRRRGLAGLGEHRATGHDFWYNMASYYPKDAIGLAYLCWLHHLMATCGKYKKCFNDSSSPARNTTRGGESLIAFSVSPAERHEHVDGVA